MTPRQRDEKRAQLSSAHLGRVYRSLADEHAERTARLREQETWQRISAKASRSNWSLLERLAPKPAYGGTLFPAAIHRGWWAALAAAVALGVALLWLGVPEQNRAPGFSFEVDGQSVSSRWIHAENDDVSLRFSDGSAVQLRPQSAVSVALEGEHGARLRLSEGSLTAQVVHADATDWRFTAGPYEVRVTGTAFDLTWDGVQLQVQMHEGSVEVTGPNRGRWTASGTELLELGRQPEARLAEKDDLSSETLEQPSAEDEHFGSAREGTDQTARRGRTRAQAVKSWAEMLAAGEFTDILRDAQRQGVDHSLASRSASELSALAQAARYAKQPAVSERAWAALQQRYPSTAMAKEAAFFLGRVAEQRGQAAAAQRQYRAYLNDGKSGQYTGEALGGLMRLLRTADPSAAEAYARRYLKSFPTGPYARLARELSGAPSR